MASAIADIRAEMMAAQWMTQEWQCLDLQSRVRQHFEKLLQ